MAIKISLYNGENPDLIGVFFYSIMMEKGTRWMQNAPGSLVPV